MRARNNLVTRAEFNAAIPATNDFAALDMNRDGRLSIQEWNWSRRSFEQQDVNGDGVITAREFTACRQTGPRGPAAPARPFRGVRRTHASDDHSVFRRDFADHAVKLRKSASIAHTEVEPIGE